MIWILRLSLRVFLSLLKIHRKIYYVWWSYLFLTLSFVLYWCWCHIDTSTLNFKLRKTPYFVNSRYRVHQVFISLSIQRRKHRRWNILLSCIKWSKGSANYCISLGDSCLPTIFSGVVMMTSMLFMTISRMKSAIESGLFILRWWWFFAFVLSKGKIILLEM